MTTLSKEEFFNRYDIDIRDGRLGGGAFGTVYKAWDNLKDEWKAIKIAEVKILNGKEFSLISEFDATKDIPIHKNIINYEAVYKFQMPNGMFDYAVMQYYPHGNLKQLVKENKLLKEHKVELINGLFYGLQILHNNGIIHRDIKPSNILISERKGHYTAKIADFGLSKNIESSDLSAITNSFGGGTLEYSSPEQLLGKPLRYNSDLWAVAVIVYELFVGKIPFVANDKTGSAEAKRRLIYQNIINAPIPPEIKNCPKPYAELIRKCLVKDPAKRIKSTEEALEIINSIAEKDEKTVASQAQGNDLVSNEDTVIISTNLRQGDLVNNVESKSEKDVVEQTNIDESSIILESGKSEIERLRKPEKKKLNLPKVDLSFLPTLFISLKSTVGDFITVVLKVLLDHKKKIAIGILFFMLTLGAYKTLSYLNTGPSFYEKNGKYGIIDLNNDTLIVNGFESFTSYRFGKAKAVRNDSLFEINRDCKIEFVKYLKEEIYSELPIVNENTNTSLSEDNTFENVESLDSLIGLSAQDPSLMENSEFVLKLNELKQQADRDAYSQAVMQNDLEAYNSYLENFPDGLHKADVEMRMTQLLDAGNVNDENDEELFYQQIINAKQRFPLQRYLTKYPNGEHVKEVRNKLAKLDEIQEQSDWAIAIKSNTVVSIQIFIQKYPNSKRKDAAVGKVNELLQLEAKSEWQKIKNSSDVSVYKSYNKRFPNSPYVKESLQIIIKISSENLWKTALSENSIERFKLIISLYPETDAAQRSRNKIKELSDIPSEEAIPPKPEKFDGNIAESLQKALAGIKSKMIKIKGGQAEIGCTKDCENDNKAIKVNVKDFYLAQYEVSQSDYQAVMGENPSTFKDCMGCPVENVSFYDAQKFIEKLNSLSGSNYRLPTELEWEYAAKANSQSKYSGSDDLIKVGVYRSNSNNGTQKSGSREPNGFKLYDMSGNVYEWCDSQYSKDGYDESASFTNEKVLRGGSWRSKSKACKIDVRGKSIPSTKNGWTGFRLARN